MRRAEEHEPGRVSVDGDTRARDQLDRALPIVYDELRRMAHAHLRSEREGHTLDTTALVHEAYLRLAGVCGIDWNSRAHFLSMASRMMRRVLVDHARARGRQKRSASADPLTEATDYLPALRVEDLLVLDDALTRLEALQPRQCHVVECRFFAGMTHEETAQALGISIATVKRDWTLARAWLNAELAAAGLGGADGASE